MRYGCDIKEYMYLSDSTMFTIKMFTSEAIIPNKEEEEVALYRIRIFMWLFIRNMYRYYGCHNLPGYWKPFFKNTKNVW